MLACLFKSILTWTKGPICTRNTSLFAKKCAYHSKIFHKNEPVLQFLTTYKNVEFQDFQFYWKDFAHCNSYL